MVASIAEDKTERLICIGTFARLISEPLAQNVVKMKIVQIVP